MNFAVVRSRACGLGLISSLLAGTAGVSAQVISEFLAQNNGLVFDENGDSPDWIEIHNPATNAITLLNWSLTDTSTNLAKWRFPAVNLDPDSYLLVFASGKDRRAAGQPLHTNFKLDSAGEFLALVAPDGVSIVSSFQPAYPPQIANVSFGLADLAVSADILAASAPARVLVPTNSALGTNWTALEFDDSGWVRGTNGVGYETSPADYASLIRTDVRAPMAVNNSCYIRLPFVVENPAAFSQWRLLVQYDDGFIAYLNGHEIARRNAPDTPAWDSAATANHPDADALIPEEFSLTPVADWIGRGTNVLAIQGLNTSTASSDFLVVATIDARPLSGNAVGLAYFPTPTPGAPNVGGVQALGPLVQDVKHFPTEPNVGDELLVQATVHPSFHPIGQVTLHYQVMFGIELLAPMFDDGAQGDGAAADGVFAAKIPAASAASGEMIRYFIVATDETGVPTRLPLFPDPRDSAEYFGTVVTDPGIQSRLPVVHWFAETPAQADTQTGTRSAVYYAGEFYDNVLFSLHGQSSSGFPKKSYNVDFARDHHFRYSPDSSRVKAIKLLTNYADKSKVRNVLGYEFIHEAGSVGHFAFQVRVQRNAQFHGILDLIEDADDRWMERVGRDPNGALYKMYNSLNSAAGNEKKTRKNEDSSDLQSFVNNLSESRPLATRVIYAYDNVDLPQTISYFVAMALISSQDHGHKNFFLYRDSERTGEWAIFPWDIDLGWGRNWIDSGGYFTDTLYQDNVLSFYNPAQQNKPSNRLYDLIFAHPDFRRMYLRRLRTVMDSVLQPLETPSAELKVEGRIGQMLDAMDPPEIGQSDADLDYAKWGSWGNRNPMRQEAQRILDTHLPGRRRFLFTNPAATLKGDSIPLSQATNASALFGVFEANPASGNQDEEFLEVLNPSDDWLDISAWALQGAVTFLFKPGTVLPARSSLYLSPNAAVFRARQAGLRGGQGLFVQGDYHGHLSSHDALLQLLDNTGRVVTQTNFPPQSPIIKSAAIAHGQLTITIAADPGRTYSIYFQDLLGSPDWNMFNTVAGPAVAGELPVVNPLQPGVGRRFYRVSSP